MVLREKDINFVRELKIKCPHDIDPGVVLAYGHTPEWYTIRNKIRYNVMFYISSGEKTVGNRLFLLTDETVKSALNLQEIKVLGISCSRNYDKEFDMYGRYIPRAGTQEREKFCYTKNIGYSSITAPQKQVVEYQFKDVTDNEGEDMKKVEEGGEEEQGDGGGGVGEQGDGGGGVGEQGGGEGSDSEVSNSDSDRVSENEGLAIGGDELLFNEEEKGEVELKGDEGEDEGDESEDEGDESEDEGDENVANFLKNNYLTDSFKT